MTWTRWARYAVAASVLIAGAGGVYLATRQGGDPVDNRVMVSADPSKPGVDYKPTIAQIIEGAASHYAKPTRADRPGVQFSLIVAAGIVTGVMAETLASVTGSSAIRSFVDFLINRVLT